MNLKLTFWGNFNAGLVTSGFMSLPVLFRNLAVLLATVKLVFNPL